MSSAKKQSFLQNLLWAIILIFALLLFVQVGLGLFTRHGQEIPVPDFTGMSLEQAAEAASADHLRLDVTDSVYVRGLPLGSVFSQNPSPNEMVKRGRRILLTINATSVKILPVPSVTGLSLRGARTEILSKGFEPGKLIYVEDMATNYVLELRMGRRRISPSDLLPAGSVIDIVLGVNPEENSTYIPFLWGRTLDVAREEIFDNSLNLAQVVYDNSVKTGEDRDRAMVYSQSPAASETAAFPLGTAVTLYMSVDSSKFAVPAAPDSLK